MSGLIGYSSSTVPLIHIMYDAQFSLVIDNFFIISEIERIDAEILHHQYCIKFVIDWGVRAKY